VWTVPTTFSVTARTETLKLVTFDSGQRPSWYVSNARMYEMFDSVGRAVSGLFTPAAGSEVVIERISQGPMRILCGTPDSATGAGVFQEDGHNSTDLLPSRVVFVVGPLRGNPEAVESSIFPLVGQIEVGRVLEWVARRRSGVLREGKVSLIGHSIVGGFRFDAGGVELDEGDQFSVEDVSGPAYGQFILDERPGVTVVFRVKASRGVITRFGSLGYNLGTSAKDRLAHDPVIQGVWALLLGILGFPALLKKLHNPEASPRPASPAAASSTAVLGAASPSPATEERRHD
jgi:hypothetical protein